MNVARVKLKHYEIRSIVYICVYIFQLLQTLKTSELWHIVYHSMSVVVTGMPGLLPIPIILDLPEQISVASQLKPFLESYAYSPTYPLHSVHYYQPASLNFDV